MEKKGPIMVLVTLQRHCARLIRSGADMALRQGCALHVVHVASTATLPEGQSAIDAQVLDYLYALSGEAGAEMCLLTAEVPVTAMAEYASENGVSQVVMGGGENAVGIAETLSQMLPGVQVLIAEDEA